MRISDWSSDVCSSDLGMDDSVSDETERFANPNRAHPHARIDGRVRGLGTQVVLPEREGLGQVAAPAGGLSSSANDLARWRSEERRVGKEWGSTGRSRGWP